MFVFLFAYHSNINSPDNQFCDAILKIEHEQGIEPRSDNRDLLAIKVKSEIFTEKDRPKCCEQLKKI